MKQLLCAVGCIALFSGCHAKRHESAPLNDCPRIYPNRTRFDAVSRRATLGGEPVEAEYDCTRPKWFAPTPHAANFGAPPQNDPSGALPLRDDGQIWLSSVNTASPSTAANFLGNSYWAYISVHLIVPQTPRVFPGERLPDGSIQSIAFFPGIENDPNRGGSAEYGAWIAQPVLAYEEYPVGSGKAGWYITSVFNQVRNGVDTQQQAGWEQVYPGEELMGVVWFNGEASIPAGLLHDYVIEWYWIGRDKNDDRSDPRFGRPGRCDILFDGSCGILLTQFEIGQLGARGNFASMMTLEIQFPLQSCAELPPENGIVWWGTLLGMPDYVTNPTNHAPPGWTWTTGPHSDGVFQAAPDWLVASPRCSAGTMYAQGADWGGLTWDSNGTP